MYRTFVCSTISISVFNNHSAFKFIGIDKRRQEHGGENESLLI